LPQLIGVHYAQVQLKVSEAVHLTVPSGEPMDDKQDYLRWLEEMWDVQKFDLQGSTEREEERTEEVLEVFRGLVRLSKRRVEPPNLTPGESPQNPD